MSITQRLGAHLPHSVARPLRGVQAVLSVDEPRRATRALDALSPRNRRTVGRAMVAVSHLATPGARRTGRAALLEAVGRSATGDRAASAAILHRVAEAPGTSVATRVEIGLMLLQMRDITGAQRIVDRFVQGQDARTPERYLLETRLYLATARYAEAARAASAAVALAPDRRAPPGLARAGHGRTGRPRSGVAAGGARAVPAPRPAAGPSAARRVQRTATASPAMPSGPRASAHALRTVGLQPLIAARRQEDIQRGMRPPERWTVGEVEYRLTASGRERRERPDQNAGMNARGIATIVEEHRASVLHPVTPWPNLQACARGRASGTSIPVVYEVRGFREETWLTQAARAGGHQRPRRGGGAPRDRADASRRTPS